jgi:hypothetical protein
MRPNEMENPILWRERLCGLVAFFSLGSRTRLGIYAVWQAPALPALTLIGVIEVCLRTVVRLKWGFALVRTGMGAKPGAYDDPR